MPFIVYRSSAGSGKTTTLVSSFLKLCLVNPSAFRHILAITFTNKAAREMKERILNALVQLSAIPCADERLMKLLCEHFKTNETDIRNRCKTSHKNILHQYSDFSVSTIDSFNHRLLKSFAHEIGLSSSFGIILNPDELIEQAVDMLINEYGTDNELNKTFDAFILQALEDEKGFSITGSIEAVAKEIFSENAKTFLMQMSTIDFATLNQFTILTSKNLKALKAIISEAAKTLEDLMQNNGIDPLELYQKEKGIAGLFKKIKAGEFNALGSYARKTLESCEWHGAKADNDLKARVSSISSKLEIAGTHLLEVYTKHLEEIKMLEVVRKNIIYTGIFNRLRYWADTLSAEQNNLPIADFNSRIAAAIADEYAPFIYEKIGNRYQHFLIDEFQDTSLLQWQNLIPLVENSLGSGNVNMLVGDGKQSIYRWRGGKVEQFVSLPDIYQAADNPISRQREKSLRTHFQSENLSSNYRSKCEIVDFNNKFFEHCLQYLDDENKKVYKDLTQAYNPNNTGGTIELCFIEKPDGGNREDVTSLHLEKLTELIRAYTPQMGGYANIAILCRTRAQVRLIASRLVEESIPVISPDSLLLHSSKAVNFILSCLKLIDKPSDRIARRQAELFLQENQDKELPGLSIPAHAAELPIYELCELLASTFKLKFHFQPFIQYFLDIVLEYQLNINQGIKAFLPYWEENKESFVIDLPEGLDAIKLMTIHKAKGLQFTVVIYPFADQDSSPNAQSRMWVYLPLPYAESLKAINVKINKELNESTLSDAYKKELSLHALDLVNLMYVALTRPQKALHIISTLDIKPIAETISVNKLLFSFFSLHPEWKQEDGSYRIGALVPFARIESEEVEAATPTSFVETGNWKKNLRIAAENSSKALGSNQEEAKNWGNTVHKALSMIHTAGDIKAVVLRLVNEQLITEEKAEHLQNILISTVSHPRLKDFFSADYKVYREREMYRPTVGNLRPDRVVLYEDKSARILDFKTGLAHDSHSAQIKLYAECLKEMKLNVLESLLVYITDQIEIESF